MSGCRHGPCGECVRGVGGGFADDVGDTSGLGIERYGRLRTVSMSGHHVNQVGQAIGSLISAASGAVNLRRYFLRLLNVARQRVLSGPGPHSRFGRFGRSLRRSLTHAVHIACSRLCPRGGLIQLVRTTRSAFRILVKRRRSLPRALLLSLIPI